MVVFLFALLSVVCSALTYLTTIEAFGIAGFVLGTAAWVMARKMRMTGAPYRLTLPAIVLGIAGTFLNLGGVLYSLINFFFETSAAVY